MATARKTQSKEPLRILFVTTSLPVGGAETLLANLVRRMDRTRFAPEIACLKERGPLGVELAKEIPVYCNLIQHKTDLWVLRRLTKLIRSRNIQAVVTVGAGDKMFWGRLAAKLAGVPVILSALHSTGWPDSIGKLNRLLTPITDGFIGVADAHAKHLVEREGFPSEKVFTIYNGVDVDRFAPQDGSPVRQELGIPADALVVTLLAALRPEKNHEFFLNAARRIKQAQPKSHFIIIGDGPRREELEQLTEKLALQDCTHFVGSRSDVPELLAASNALALTSHNEASPVSILEALSCEVPVVSAEVGSVAETVIPGKNGFLYECGDMRSFVSHTLRILNDPKLGEKLGKQGRASIEAGRSLAVMVEGYEKLIENVYSAKHAEQPTAEPVATGTKRVADFGAT